MHRSPRHVAAAVVGVVLAVGLVVAPTLAAGPSASRPTTRVPAIPVHPAAPSAPASSATATTTKSASITPTAGKGGGGTGGTTTSPWTGTIAVTPTNVGIGAITPLTFKFKGAVTAAQVFRIAIPSGYPVPQRTDATAGGYVGTGSGCITFKDFSTGSRSFRVDVTCTLSSPSTGDIVYNAKPAGSGSAKFVVSNVTTATVTQLASLSVNAVALRIALGVVPTSVAAGGSVTATATVSDSKGGKYAGVPVAFSDSIDAIDPAVATAYTNASGIATVTYSPETAASHRLTAAITGTNTSAARNFTVTAGPLATIALAGPATELVSGASATYTVSGQDQYGNTVTISASDNVAFEITADTDVVSVATTASSATLTGGLVGDVSISASASCTDCFDGPIDFSVVAGPLATYDHVTDRDSGTTGDALTVTIENAADAAGNPLALDAAGIAVSLDGATAADVSYAADGTSATIVADLSGVTPDPAVGLVLHVGDLTSGISYDLRGIPQVFLSLDYPSGSTGDVITITASLRDAYGAWTAFDGNAFSLTATAGETTYVLNDTSFTIGSDPTTATRMIAFQPDAAPGTVTFTVTIDGVVGTTTYELSAAPKLQLALSAASGTVDAQPTLTIAALDAQWAYIAFDENSTFAIAADGYTVSLGTVSFGVDNTSATAAVIFDASSATGPVTLTVTVNGTIVGTIPYTIDAPADPGSGGGDPAPLAFSLHGRVARI